MSWDCDDIIYYVQGADFSKGVYSKDKDLQQTGGKSMNLNKKRSGKDILIKSLKIAVAALLSMIIAHELGLKKITAICARAEEFAKENNIDFAVDVYPYYGSDNVLINIADARRAR